jgi:hypothetical protein
MSLLGLADVGGPGAGMLVSAAEDKLIRATVKSAAPMRPTAIIATPGARHPIRQLFNPK